MDDRVLTALGAIVGIPLLFAAYLLLSERLLGYLPIPLRPRLRPYVWVSPAVAFATVFMVLPTLNTVVLSFMDRNSRRFVGLDNYVFFFTNPATLGSLKNSLLWLVFFSGLVVVGGLLIAVLVDRVRYESIAKTAVFLPLPISAVAASIIWKFMYEYQPPGSTQTGTLNALIGAFGLPPVAWLVETATNNWALIFVGVWTATGFAMVIISASLKAISPELLEAARLDGASELQVLMLVTTPLLMPTITVVATTMVITALKVFDIVYVLTAGAYDTDVIASQMFTQLTGSGHYGRAAAVGVVLLVAIIPLLVLNVRRFRQQEELR
ncbi:MAG TPA: sugar ABC transporter permease [Candidatus Limnocylindrales bacterium]|nr:sugar ABC transporter permease [Candidatus Limnocylindrales bacterium]